MPLLPEKSLSVSPQLAATIGLEEALLYQLLADFLTFSPGHGGSGMEIDVDCQHLQELLPFWRDSDIRRISNGLQEKGLLSILSAPFGRASSFCFAFGETRTATPAPAPSPTVKQTSHRTRAISTSWQPAPDVVAQLNQYGIPQGFVQAQLPEFVTYWSERGDPQHSWNSKFLKHVMRSWRQEETRSHKQSLENIMTSDWQPSPDAVDILHRQAGISVNFIEDAIPEFILYWSERGERRSTWNTDFVRHVKNQWAKFQATIENDGTPRVIEKTWQPSEDLFEVLQLANIPRDFALQQIPEFVLFWRENGQATNSWNTKFLQHVKRQWARQGAIDERSKTATKSGKLRGRSLTDALSDRSWAN